MSTSGRALPKGAMATETQWMSEEQAQKLAEDPKNRVYRWAPGRESEPMPAQTVFRIVQFWRDWNQLRVAENPVATQPQLEALMTAEENRRTGTDQIALRKFRKDYPTFFQHLSTPNVSPKILEQMFQLIQLRLKEEQKNRSEKPISKEEVLAMLIAQNTRPPTEDEARLIRQGKATSLDSLSFLQNRRP